jgi:hypothetical protein
MRTMTGLVRVLGLSAAVLVGSGCGRSDLPELGTVEGTVTMDGQPVVGKQIQFLPESGGRPGTGITDEQGHYELTYTAGVAGTKVGPNRIEITTTWPEGEPKPGERETIPPRYNSTTELTRDVQPGHNTFDFELTSGRAAKK